MNFKQQKNEQLSKKDKSSIGKWDEKIVGLCNEINKKREYYTTSSCAGRIVLLKGVDKKKPNMFLFRTHDKINFRGLKRILDEVAKKYTGLVLFKQESCILHVCCKDVDSANLLLKKARECGWKRSGIISMNGRVMCELHSTESLSLPIMADGKVLVNEYYLKLLVKEANKRLEKTWGKVEKLKRLF